MLEVGSKIHEWRCRRGYTQAMLAAECGIPQPNLSGIEKGRRDLTVATLLRIAVALKVKPAQLFAEDEIRRPPALTRKTIEAIAFAVAHPQSSAPDEIRRLAGLFREILPGRNPRGAFRKMTAAWMDLRKQFTAQEIRGICQRARDEAQRI